MNRHFEVFDDALTRSVEEVFLVPAAAQRHDILPPALPADVEVVIATMGFVAEYARGGVTVMATRASVRAMTPIELDDSPTTDCDVLGELTNMLLSRIKNELLRRGTVVLLGLPSSVVATTVRIPESRDRATSSGRAFEVAPGHTVTVRVEASFDERLDLESPRPSESVGREGTMLFF